MWRNINKTELKIKKSWWICCPLSNEENLPFKVIFFFLALFRYSKEADKSQQYKNWSYCPDTFCMFCLLVRSHAFTNMQLLLHPPQQIPDTPVLVDTQHRTFCWTKVILCGNDLSCWCWIYLRLLSEGNALWTFKHEFSGSFRTIWGWTCESTVCCKYSSHEIRVYLVH